MLAEKRHKMIYEIIQSHGAVTTATLMNKFNVSIETIRRDLLSMEQKGLLKRVHGGAVELSGPKKFYDLNKRTEEFITEKRELSINAAAFINEGDTIFVDEGSTAISFSEVLKENFSNLTIVTHSLDVFNILYRHENFNVILCGGRFKKEENAFYGSLVLDALSKIYVQKAFIFPSAVSIELGICDYQEDLYQVQRKVLERSGLVYILADSSKFEKSALLKLDEMKNEYHYISDSKLSDELVKIYKENGINIYK